MAVVRYEVLVGIGVSDMKSTLSFTNLDDALDFYDDLCKVISRYVSNHKGSIFRGVFLLKNHDVIKAHYYCNNNGRLSDKEIKYYL